MDGTLCILAEPTEFHPLTCEPNANSDGESHPIVAADDLRIAIPVALIDPPDAPLCPRCFSEDICELTREDEEPWGCLDCSASFTDPVEPPEKPEPAYTVLGIYEDNGQLYATSVYTWNGTDAAEEITQRVCREDNEAETGDDLLRIVGVIEGEHAVVGGEPDAIH
ncbi:MAG: hypothetical protein JSS68_09325 [Actinobacteria bacterium]|nr:hypothetical protein [Actinomycetota bacterium]MBS1882932.1 hypothetical protein [Actinomycetota bacterium]